MTCTTPVPITNDMAAKQPYEIKLGLSWIFGYWFYEDKQKTKPIDVSNLEIVLIIFEEPDNPVMKILNEDWERDATNHIFKKYDIFDELREGIYSYQLLVKDNNDTIVLLAADQITVKDVYSI